MSAAGSGSQPPSRHNPARNHSGSDFSDYDTQRTLTQTQNTQVSRDTQPLQPTQEEAAAAADTEDDLSDSEEREGAAAAPRRVTLREVNQPGQFGRTPLMREVQAGHADVVQRLLAQGANVHCAIEQGGILALAVAGGNLVVVRLLLEAGAVDRGDIALGLANLSNRPDLATLIEQHRRPPTTEIRGANGEPAAKRQRRDPGVDGH